MGVPVVTLAGDRPSARLGATALDRVGLSHLITSNRTDYVRIAVELAQDQPRLASLRRGARARFVTSPLHNANAFAKAFDAACLVMWHTGYAQSE
jgi:predicted O-linked N-acetylglucosamine transferase (SPINDLY family)